MITNRIRKLIVCLSISRGTSIAQKLGLEPGEYAIIGPHSVRSIEGLRVKPDDLVYEPGVHDQPEMVDVLDILHRSLIKGGW